MKERSSFDHTTKVYSHYTQVVVQSHLISSNCTGFGEEYGRNLTMTTMINQGGLSRPVKQ
jgi:hypothetical protein